MHTSPSVASQQRQAGKFALKVLVHSFVDLLSLTYFPAFPFASHREIYTTGEELRNHESQGLYSIAVPAAYVLPGEEGRS